MSPCRPPLVGITTYRTTAAWGPWERDAVLLPAAYHDRVEAAGGHPLLVPSRRAGAAGGAPWAAQVVGAVDALVVVGGGDIDPRRYGQDPDPRTDEPDSARDASELALVGAALEQRVPVLAICRGVQLLNVALGGTLHQHLPDVVGHDGHRPARGCFDDVKVTTVPGTRVHAAVGPSLVARCSHHQAIGEVAPGLVVSATADDGTVEALEVGAGPAGDPGPFVVGVQWHPEEQADVRLFRALVEAAAR